MVINDGLEKIDLTCFPNLRSLKLKYPSNKQIRQLLQPGRLPCLEYLSLGSAADRSPSSMIVKLHRHLFSDGFPSIHSCFLTDTPDPMVTWSSSPGLLSLTLHGPVTLSVYSAVLEACPNLSRLTLNAFKDRSTASPMPSSRHSLRFLSILITKWSTNTMIDSLLTHVPALEQFSVHIHPPVSKIDFSQLASILLDRTPRLSRFDCDMMVYRYTIDTAVVHRLHPCFTRIKCCLEHGRFHIFTSNGGK